MSLPVAPRLEHVRRALSGTPVVRDPSPSDPIQAAVALVLREIDNATELLFIRRAEHPLDPWSGHMAFPGGRIDPGDEDPLAAARRETREEIALDLESEAEWIGSLDLVPMIARGRRLGMTIAPYVFELTGTPSLRLNEEVAAIHWVSLARLASTEERVTFPYRRDDTALDLPSVPLGESRIWGLTLGMTDSLLHRAATDRSEPTASSRRPTEAPRTEPA